MSRGRHRRSARDIANLPGRRGGLFTIGLVVVGLALVFGLKMTLGDQSSETFQLLVGDPDLELPPSASESDALLGGAPQDAGVPDTAGEGSAVDATVLETGQGTPREPKRGP